MQQQLTAGRAKLRQTGNAVTAFIHLPASTAKTITSVTVIVVCQPSIIFLQFLRKMYIYGLQKHQK